MIDERVTREEEIIARQAADLKIARVRRQEKLRAYKNAVEGLLNHLEEITSRAHDLYKAINDDYEEASR